MAEQLKTSIDASGRITESLPPGIFYNMARHRQGYYVEAVKIHGDKCLKRWPVTEWDVYAITQRKLVRLCRQAVMR